MNITNVVRKLLKFDNVERPVEVVLNQRDKHGVVVSKKCYPVSAVFSHSLERATITIEESSSTIVEF